MQLNRLPTLVVRGIAGGMAAGIVFALVETALSVAIGDSASRPFQAIGHIVLDRQSSSPGYPLSTVVATGIGIHFLLSVLYAVIFVLLLGVTRQVGNLTSVVIAEGVLYAMALWVINFLVIAPALFSALAELSDFSLSFTVAHAFYGLALGGYVLAATKPQAQVSVR